MKKPPPHLGTYGKALYSGLIADFGIDDSAGLALATMAAECLDRLRDAQALIEKHGMLVSTDGGGLKTNGAVAVEHNSHNRMLAALRALNVDLEPLRDRPGRPSGADWKGRTK
ncbi:MAG: hypothetical protein GEU87_13670 [Alphaproteobacteria bacterium]|nr:hypothetical protein [Alphaproteobacteria bacterium]